MVEISIFVFLLEFMYFSTSFIFVSMLSLPLFALMSSCTSEGPKNVDAHHIGLIAPLSGEMSRFGEEAKRSAELALEGAHKAYPDIPLELIAVDGACNVEASRKVMEDLVKIHHVDAVLGGICSAETFGASSVAESSGVVLLSPSSNALGIEYAGEYVYRIAIPSDATHRALTARINNSTDHSNLILDFSNFPQVQYEPTVLSHFTISLLDAPLQSEDFLKYIQENSAIFEGAVGASFPVDIDPVLLDAFSEGYSRLHGNPPSALELSAPNYDAMRLLAEAVFLSQREGISVKEVLDRPGEHRTIFGTFHFDAQGEPVYENYLYTIMNGKIVSHLNK